MSTDRTTKALLLAIALGLWVNITGQWLTPIAIHAQGDDSRIARALSDIESRMRSIEDEIHKIGIGNCLNSKLC